jgi:hypothetical protein
MKSGLPSRAPAGPVPGSAQSRPSPRRWLLFVHQLPATLSNLRVSTWRRLQQLGAMSLKQAVYVLPDTPNTREDFEWLRSEVKGAGGEASVFAADSVDAWSDDALVEEFRRSGQAAYASLARDAARALKRASGAKASKGTRAPALRRLLDIFRERLNAIEGIDFFGSAGRDRVIALLEQLDGRTSDADRTRRVAASPASGEVTMYQRRLWITRPRPGVDRMSSAWLIRRFIDPEARFGFAADRESVPADGVPFDMFGVEFSHQAEHCTFETLCSVFDLRASALSRIAAIVHDLDLKDGRFGAPECATVGAMIEGLRLAYADDEGLLAQGMTLFDSLYRSFDQSARSAGLRPVARSKKKPAATTNTRRPGKGRRRS